MIRWQDKEIMRLSTLFFLRTLAMDLSLAVVLLGQTAADVAVLKTRVDAMEDWRKAHEISSQLRADEIISMGNRLARIEAVGVLIFALTSGSVFLQYRGARNGKRKDVAP